MLTATALALAGCQSTVSSLNCTGPGCVTGSITAPEDIDAAIAGNALSEINRSSVQKRARSSAESNGEIEGQTPSRKPQSAPNPAGANRPSSVDESVVANAIGETTEAVSADRNRQPILRRLFAGTPQDIPTASQSSEGETIEPKTDGEQLRQQDRDSFDDPARQNNVSRRTNPSFVVEETGPEAPTQKRQPLFARIFNRGADPIVTGSVEDGVTRTLVDVEDLENSAALAQANSDAAPARPRRPLTERVGARDMDLPQAIAAAVTADPRVGLARAQTEEAEAAVRGAEAALAPRVSARVSTGVATTGDFEEYSNIVDTGTIEGFGRADFGVSARKLLFDFKSTRDTINRSEATARARQFELLDEVENVALETTDAYLGVLQQRSLVNLSKKNVEALKALLVLVETNEEAGNATVADVKRVSSRIIESETLLTDLESALDDSLDRFQRLARVEAGKLNVPRVKRQDVPVSADEALTTIGQTNPRLLALDAVGLAIDSELRSQQAQRRGRLEARVDASMNNQLGTQTSTQTDVRGLLVFTADLYDGGASQSLSDQIMARDRQNDMRYRRVREELEANLRQFYRAIKTAQSKTERLQDGVEDSAKVNELYIEQFQAGTRTIFELLDSQTALFTAERELIVNQYAELRALYQIKRATGTLAPTLLSEQ
ncbi:MAG: TolC family protein [Pseudomonadota bacterium]